MAKVGVLLSGCGHRDGAEIHESVLTLLALDRAGAEALCLAPDVEAEVVDHRTGEPTGERRNVLVEAARIARGAIRDVAQVGAAELDALILPGGYGAAKNLTDFARAGAGCRVLPQVARLVNEMQVAGKPIGAICIAPAVVAAALRERGVSAELTIGDDAATAQALEAMGARHVPCTVERCHVDETRGIVSTPAYMLAGGIAEAAAGIDRLVAAVLRRVR